MLLTLAGIALGVGALALVAGTFFRRRSSH